MGTPAPPARLVGREAEIRVLAEALDRVASGLPSIVLIEGEAGIGKSRVLGEALQDARARGMQVVAGRAEELEQARPFGLLTAAFECASPSPDPLRAAIAALLATHGGGDRGPITVTSDPGLQFRAVDAFSDLVETLALAGPLAIGVDDLQWADPSSLLTLGAVGRLGYVPVALIGCMRPAPRIPELDRLVGALETAGSRHLALGPLRDAAVRDLVAETVAAEPGPGLLEEISGAAGNPLFITELLGAIIQEGAIETAGGRAEVRKRTLPPTLRLTILRRLSFLPDATLQALQTASILGSAFSLTDLATVADRTALGLVAALTEAIRTGVLRDDGAQLRFSHDLIRDAIYQDLPGSMRQALHREAGQRLAHARAPAPQVAEHLARGAAPGDGEAITWLTRAAREAAATSPHAAADLMERAIKLTGPADPSREQLLAEQASSLMWAGRVAEAEQICRDLLGRTRRPAVEGRARICLGLTLLAAGRIRDGLRELERAAGLPLLTDADRAVGLGWASLARMWRRDLDGAAAMAEQARSVAAAAGEHLAISIALGSLSAAAKLRGQLPDALRIIDDAVRLADQSPGRQGHRYPVLADHAFVLVECDRLEEARNSLGAGRRISEELGMRWHLPSYQTVSAIERFTAGEWDDAIADVEANIGLGDEPGGSRSLIVARSVLSVICLHRNDLSRAAEAAIAAAAELAETGARYRSQWALWAHALTLEADGKIAEALATLSGCWDQCAQLGLALEYRVLGADLVRLALAAGDTGQARDVSASVAELAAASDVPSITGAALRCQGLAEDDAKLLRAAVEAYARAPRPLELALCSEEAAAAFARRGDVDQARPLLEQALDVYERLDAARDLARAEAVLRGMGVRRGRRGPRGRPQFGWPSLTPTEQTIAGLVADGLSNPQIGHRLYISRRTAQTHLAHIFAKLDITSRAQLAAYVTRRGHDEPPGRNDPGLR